MQRWMTTLIAAAAATAVPLAAAGLSFAADPAPATPPAAAPAATPAAPAADAAAKRVLTPAKTWFAPGQPLEIKVAAEGEVSLVLTEFTGGKVEPKGATDVAGGSTTDLRKLYAQVDAAGTYILYAVPKGKPADQFVGTPLVIGVRADGRAGAPGGAMVTKVQPLQYVQMATVAGPFTMAFYYDVAPNTVDNFLTLAGGGFYDGLLFHRVIPDFVIQGGDPRGDGSGGPGYQIDAEFNDRKHTEGVLSMARSRERDSAGSQFFVCLNYAGTKNLDKQYTAFGQVVTGFEGAKKIAATPRDQDDRPTTPQPISKAEVRDVTAADNPYPAMQKMLAGG